MHRSSKPLGSGATRLRYNRKTFWLFVLMPVVLVLMLGACSDNGKNDNGNAAAGNANATRFRITVANVSQPQTLATDRADGTVPLSPGAYAVFQGGNPGFEAGASANAGIERIAEDGFAAAPLGTAVSAMGSVDNVSSSGYFSQPFGNLPALEAGESAVFTVIAAPGDKLTLQTI